MCTEKYHFDKDQENSKDREGQVHCGTCTAPQVSILLFRGRSMLSCSRTQLPSPQRLLAQGDRPLHRPLLCSMPTAQAL